ncbi:Rpn family recombination-promoting nuclease/putative transposase [Nostoc sp. UHCC 0870]|uniref:Rpn family recombination-promoting nuclease/putative transposase n=1 Tax=Nostoc sp. UHCC 0870 TaxID=2914041 RepID=UPI001EDE3510|nr:Rpn family recombination-promoting nuclease/putative transposase [Nostoc sp. UHCC 0870]UKO96870.1 Rpn family recombination-promoting nuclease/putative transposase [Nostoc sp. UHCC 0870]
MRIYFDIVIYLCSFIECVKTDSILYRLFKTFPGVFFELLGQSPVEAEAYEFLSVEVKSLLYETLRERSNSKFKIQNPKLKTISGSLNSPLIVRVASRREDRQIIRAASRREDCGSFLYPQLINSKLFPFFLTEF